MWKSNIVVFLGEAIRIFLWKYNIHDTITKMFSLLINIQEFVDRWVICP